ncbi:glycosyltransferase family 8 protein [Paenibacillus motobuensis]|uniref:Glycosyl transferase family 8 n=1 Tax=Paenibacillus motobuensis TaxID=295324 RepID=A0ABN0XZG8_9BACL
MNIISVCDDKYAQHLGVMFTSLLENTKAKNLLFYIIDGGISDFNKEKLARTVKKYNNSIEFLNVNKQKYSSFALKNNMSHAAYYKLSIPELVPIKCNKVIFLDCDLIILDDIEELWKVDVSDHNLAAVLEPEFTRHEELKLDKNVSYFNSGVMLINLDLWRENNISEKAYKYLEGNSYNISLHDQDAFNVVLSAYPILTIPQRWNQRPKYILKDFPSIYYSEKEFTEAVNNPAIVHFAGGNNKPWHYLCDHPNANDYVKYQKKSEWYDYVPPEQIKMNSRKIVIFGTGNACVKIFDKVKKYNLTYFVDNNPSMWNKQIYDITIFPPSALLSEEKDNIFIIIASMYYDEIKVQLESYGFEEFEHFISGIGKR